MVDYAFQLIAASAIDGTGGAEVAAHPLFGRIGEGVLFGKAEDVLIAAGEGVESPADFVENLGLLGKGVNFFGAEALQPAEDVEIAQAAGAFLDVGFEVMDGALKALVAAAGHGGELEGKAGRGLAAGVVERLIEGGFAGEQAAIEEADVEFDVALGDPFAFGDGVDTVAGAVAAVPEDADELAEFATGKGAGLLDDQEIDIGKGEKL